MVSLKDFRGITTYLNIYTDSQYSQISTKLVLLFGTVFTALMIFYVAEGQKHLKDAETSLKVTGTFGIAYVSFAFIDCFFRVKYAFIRIFDELSLICAYSCLWTLMFVLFQTPSIVVLITTLIIIGWGISNVKKHHSVGNLEGGRLDPRILDMIDVLAEEGDPNSVLSTAAFMALLIKPEEQEAKELFGAVIAASFKASIKRSTNSVPPEASENPTEAQSLQINASNLNASGETNDTSQQSKSEAKKLTRSKHINEEPNHADYWKGNKFVNDDKARKNNGSAAARFPNFKDGDISTAV